MNTIERNAARTGLSDLEGDLARDEMGELEGGCSFGGWKVDLAAASLLISICGGGHDNNPSGGRIPPR